jgi:hypothetical protein
MPGIKLFKTVCFSEQPQTTELTLIQAMTMLVVELFLGFAYSLTYQQEVILKCLRAQLGKPFLLGANGPNVFDCSSLTRYCQEAANITGLPRTSIDQSKVGKTIDCRKADVGDVIFFYNPVSHVGTFSSHVGVIHGVNEEKPISEYPNIFLNSFWNPLINVCKRHWNDNPAAPPATTPATPAPTET